MILGIGIDVVDVNGFREQLSDVASSFVQGSFTHGEQLRVSKRPAGDKAPHYAARYAAKEAFIKAWSSSRRGLAPVLPNMRFTDVEVTEDSWGRPAIQLHGETLQAFDEAGDHPRIHLSISHDGPVATAYVMLEEAPPHRSSGEKP